MKAIKSAIFGRQTIHGHPSRSFGRFIRTGLLAVLLMFLSAHRGSAQSTNLWSTERILAYSADECAALEPGACESLSSAPVTIPDVGPYRITLQCPKTSPYLVGWDTQQKEFLRVVVVSPHPGEEPHTSRALASPDRLTVSAINDAVADGQPAVGDVQLYIGCSQYPWNGTPFASERRGLPSPGLLRGASQEESGDVSH